MIAIAVLKLHKRFSVVFSRNSESHKLKHSGHPKRVSVDTAPAPLIKSITAIHSPRIATQEHHHDNSHRIHYSQHFFFLCSCLADSMLCVAKAGKPPAPSRPHPIWLNHPLSPHTTHVDSQLLFPVSSVLVSRLVVHSFGAVSHAVLLQHVPRALCEGERSCTIRGSNPASLWRVSFVPPMLRGT